MSATRGARTILATCLALATVLTATASADALAPDIDLATVSDARLGVAMAYYQNRLKRVPTQLAALDTELDQVSGALDRASVVARKDRVRASALEDQRVIAAIQQELSFREGSKHDDAAIARQLEEVGRDRESERAAERVTDTSSSVAKDRFLDSVLAKQDREVEAREERSRFRRKALRVTVTLAGLGGIIAMLVIVLRRSS